MDAALRQIPKIFCGQLPAKINASDNDGRAQTRILVHGDSNIVDEHVTHIRPLLKTIGTFGALREALVASI
jgi:hypothetical protein